MSRHLPFQQLSASLDDELTGVPRELVERHLVACPECDAVMERLIQLDAEMVAVIAEDPGEEFFDELLAMVRGKTEALEEAARVLGPESVEASPAPARPPARADRAAGRAPAAASRPAAPNASRAAAPPVLPGRRPESSVSPVRARAPRSPERSRSRMGRAWITAAGLLLLPLAALVGLRTLGTRPARDLGLRSRTASQQAASVPAPVRVPAETLASDSTQAPPGTDSLAALAEVPPADSVVAPEPAAAATLAPEPAPPEPVAPPPAAPRKKRTAPATPRDPPVAIRPRNDSSTSRPWTIRREVSVTTGSTAPAEVGMLCGEVLNAGGNPVAGAEVAIEGAGIAVLSDHDGRFCMSVPVGDRTLVVRAAGFARHRGPVRVGKRTPERSITLAAAR